MMNNLDTWSLHGPLPRLRDKVSSESLLEDVNAAPHTIPIFTITETNKLMYTTAAVIPHMLGYDMNNTLSSKGQYPPMETKVGGPDQGRTER